MDELEDDLVRRPLKLPPGDYVTVPATQIRLRGFRDDPTVVMIEFHANLSADPNYPLSIAVPIPKLEAAGLLRSLKILQEKGLIPFVPEAIPTKN